MLVSFVGIHPPREGGIRVCREDVLIDGQRRILVHNHGAGGTGFQAGYGMALDSVATIEDLLRDIRNSSPRARLEELKLQA
jgi:hypothetical protein